MATGSVRCDCTLEWCKKKREQLAAEGKSESRHFSLPSLAATNGGGPRVIERKQILHALRPKGKDVSTNSTLVFLWWHLRPSAFEWRGSFAKKTKDRTPRWFVRSGVPLAFSNLYEEPPPDKTNAVFNGEHWEPITGPADQVVEEAPVHREFKTREVNKAWRVVQQVAAHDQKTRKAVEFLKDYVDHIKKLRDSVMYTPSYAPAKRDRTAEGAESGELGEASASAPQAAKLARGPDATHASSAAAPASHEIRLDLGAGRGVHRATGPPIINQDGGVHHGSGFPSQAGHDLRRDDHQGVESQSTGHQHMQQLAHQEQQRGGRAGPHVSQLAPQQGHVDESNANPEQSHQDQQGW